MTGDGLDNWNLIEPMCCAWVVCVGISYGDIVMFAIYIDVYMPVLLYVTCLVC
jgi:hypothetical protein